jgi:hypothetical protein
MADTTSTIDWKIIIPYIEAKKVKGKNYLRILSSFPKLYLDQIIKSEKMDQLLEDYINKAESKDKLFQIIIKLKNNLFLSRIILLDKITDKDGERTPTKDDINEDNEAQKVLNDTISSLKEHFEGIGNIKFVSTKRSGRTESDPNLLEAFLQLYDLFLKLKPIILESSKSAKQTKNRALFDLTTQYSKLTKTIDTEIIEDTYQRVK